MTIALVLLAAGGSTRLGSPKQFVLHEGRSLVRRAAETAVASGYGPLVVVIGPEVERVRAELAGLSTLVVEHPAWSRGIGSSIAKGASAVPDDADALILLLCDQPGVTADHLSALASAHRSSGRSIVAAAYAGTRGPPVLFARKHFDALRALDGDAGARRVIERDATDVEEVPMPEAAFDVDTPEDRQRLIGS